MGVAVVFSSLVFLILLWMDPSIAEGNRQLEIHEFRENPTKAFKQKAREPCIKYKKHAYRLINGQCNNPSKRLWGSALMPLLRDLPNAYQDGVSKPRHLSVDKKTALPSPREVSVKCFGPKDSIPAADFTLMVVHWGAFVAVDISHTRRTIEDCTCNSTDPECRNIPVPRDDDFYNHTTDQCIPFKRTDSTTVKREVKGEETRVREPFNTVTAYLDASNIYGNSEVELEALRTHSDSYTSEMRVVDLGPKGDFLPPETCGESCKPGRGQYCFLSGSERVNLVPGLAVIHTMFVRQHNIIAKYLRENMKSNVDDETIFQETRKIIGALFQHITYSEFLPVVLGEKAMDTHMLRPHHYNYSSEIRADLVHGFSSGAFRFGHALIPETVTIPDVAVVQLQALYWNTGPVFTLFGDLVDVLTTQRGKAVDRHFSHSASRHLFPQRGDTKTRDLVSMNIQRGRTHGLPSYNAHREHVGLERETSLKKLFSDSDECASVYRHIDDVDLYTGGLAEKPLDDGIVGPTFNALMAKQFKDLMNGDRFFYQNQNKHVQFTPEQLNSLIGMKLNKVICDTTSIESIPENVFRPISKNNPMRKCSDLPGLDLSLWAQKMRRKY